MYLIPFLISLISFHVVTGNVGLLNSIGNILLGLGNDKLTITSHHQSTSDVMEACESLGRFGHPASCKQYLLCQEIGAKPRVITCNPSHTRFDPLQQRCLDESEASPCTLCTNDEGKTLPDPETDANYFRCVKGQARHYRCPMNMTYDTDVKKCTKSYNKLRPEPHKIEIADGSIIEDTEGKHTNVKDHAAGGDDQRNEGELVEEVVVDEDANK